MLIHYKISCQTLWWPRGWRRKNPPSPSSADAAVVNNKHVTFNNCNQYLPSLENYVNRVDNRGGKTMSLFSFEKVNIAWYPNWKSIDNPIMGDFTQGGEWLLKNGTISFYGKIYTSLNISIDGSRPTCMYQLRVSRGQKGLVTLAKYY